MVHYDGERRIIIHEDCVFPEESRKVINYIDDKIDITKDDLLYSNPSIGLGKTLDNLVNNYITSDFVFYIQDDFEFERPIDLNRLLWLMKKHDDINLIFLKRSKNRFVEEVDIDGVNICKFILWSFNPGLWRMSTFRKYWKPTEIEPELEFNMNIGTPEVRRDMGLYVLGRHDSYNHIRHLGYDCRMAKWHQVDSKPGKHPTKEAIDLKNRAPWLGILEK